MKIAPTVNIPASNLTRSSLFCSHLIQGQKSEWDIQPSGTPNSSSVEVVPPTVELSCIKVKGTSSFSKFLEEIKCADSEVENFFKLQGKFSSDLNSKLIDFVQTEWFLKPSFGQVLVFFLRIS